jgi:uncharacterized cupin superfamily protein
MASVNLNQVELDWRQEEPGYSWQAAVLGPALGASRIGATLYELPPGQASFPYHYEYGCEEWLLVLTGEVTLRDPEGERALAAGDVVCFPEGPQGAHRVANHGEQPARIVLFSTKGRPAVAVFPDSDKLVLFSGGEPVDDVIAGRSDSLDYWEGER